MKNAHLRMGKLTFVRQTRDTITNVSVHLHRLIAERPRAARSSTQIHLLSAFGGDQELGAMIAAALEGLRFQVAFEQTGLIGSLAEKPVVYRASFQVPGRKRPVRHAVLLSKELFETTLGANSEARRTVLFDDQADFILHRLSVRFGLPVLPVAGYWRWRESIANLCAGEADRLSARRNAAKRRVARLKRMLLAFFS
ncbi:MAG TPA: hypothetical protein VFL57_18295 [Bryobacteraceae bacterium]|nr:hypothetical protein [Bryobacteraceae bacterium]